MTSGAKQHTPDLIILGSGSTAFAAALRANSHGAQVLMIEKSALGGACINWGCIPSKTLIHAALFRHATQLGRGIGLDATGLGVDYERLGQHRDRVVTELRQTRYLDVLKNVSGLELVKGTARFVDRNRVMVDDRSYRADRFLVAVGGMPKVLPIPGLEATGFLTSREALLMKKLPRSLVIVGGGVIAVELGQMFCRLGCRVTILEHGPRLLPAVEREPGEALQEVLTAEGITVVTNAAISSVARIGDLTVVNAVVEGHGHEYTAEKLLLAVGTAPATTGIGLEKVGVRTDGNGFILTDDFLRTTAPGIWAAGDVTGRMMIATAGARQGIVAVDDMFSAPCRCSLDLLSIPMAIFSDPEIGMVGYTEERARTAGFDTMVNTIPASLIPKAQVTGHTSGVIKMVAERESGRLLGVHLACHRGADIINEAALAIRLKATVSDLATALHVYPSMSEGLRLCAQGFSQDLSRMSCCAE